MLRMCVYMHFRFVENHPIRILEDGSLISKVVLSHHTARVVFGFRHCRQLGHELHHEEEGSAQWTEPPSAAIRFTLFLFLFSMSGSDLFKRGPA
jgi:hypothetical protein